MTPKYKLIHLVTGEEHLCDKVTIEGFDYYVSNELPKDQEGYWIYIGVNGQAEIHKSDFPIGWFKKIWDNGNYKPPIATNNPSIDLPQVVDEVEQIIKKTFYEEDGINFKRTTIGADDWISGLKFGYNKHAETHPNSNQDMIEFASYLFYNVRNDLSLEQQLTAWQSQQPIKIYYK